LAPSVSDGFLAVHFLVVNVVFFDDLVDVFDNVLVNVPGANLVEFFGEVFMRKVESSFVAGNKHDVFIVLSLFLDDAMHVFIHVSPDENVDSAVFGSFGILLRLEIVFGYSNVAELLYLFHFFLVDFASKGVVELVQCLDVGIVVVYVLSVQYIKQLSGETFVPGVFFVRLEKVRI
jgi:hypothetical protein